MNDGQPAPDPSTPSPGRSTSFRKIARGTLWNWSQIATTGLVAFFVSPFVVHRLGSTTYGVWVLVSSVVSYMALLDLGIRGAVVRFVSADHARGLHADAGRAVSAAIWFRLWLGALALSAAGVVALVATHAFHIPPELHTAARLAILISGISVSVSLINGVFSGVLNALHRFDLICATTMAASVFNAIGVVTFLSIGRGIVAIALWQLTTVILSGASMYRLSRRIYPELTLTLQYPGRELIRKFGSYSLFLFITAAASQVIYYSDNVVIGAFLPVSAVTLYALGFQPTQYLRQAVASITVTFLPSASHLAARGEYDQLRRLLIQGTRAVMAIALTIEAGFFVRGGTFISLWMGPQYGDVSGRVLRVLTIAWIFIAGNSCAGYIVFGLSKHRPFAIGSIFEAIANLSLSIFLVRRIGVIGVAWGTTLSGLTLNLLVWPRYITKLLDIPLGRYLFQCWLRPMLAIVPFAVGCFLVEKLWPPKHLAIFFLQMAALLPLAGAGLAVVFRREVRSVLRARSSRRAAVTAIV